MSFNPAGRRFLHGTKVDCVILFLGRYVPAMDIYLSVADSELINHACNAQDIYSQGFVCPCAWCMPWPTTIKLTNVLALVQTLMPSLIEYTVFCHAHDVHMPCPNAKARAR